MDKKINETTIEITETIPSKEVVTKYNCEALKKQNILLQARIDKNNDILNRADKAGIVNALLDVQVDKIVL